MQDLSLGLSDELSVFTSYLTKDHTDNEKQSRKDKRILTFFCDVTKG